jgi:hypothetical protein
LTVVLLAVAYLVGRLRPGRAVATWAAQRTRRGDHIDRELRRMITDQIRADATRRAEQLDDDALRTDEDTEN